MKSINLNNKAYVTGFILLMLLNSCLVIFLIQNVFAQNSDNIFKNQPPIIAEVVKQSDSPVEIRVVNVENSNSVFQIINCVVQNKGDKPIRAFTIVGNTKTNGRVSTQYFGYKYFQPNEQDNYEFGFERQNIKDDDLISLSVDYVLFENGDSWGEDTQKESERIAGNLEGKKNALKYLTNLFNDKKTNLIEDILKKETLDLPIPVTDSEYSLKRQSGFRQGYKSVLGQLKFVYEKEGIIAVSRKIEEMIKFEHAEEK